MKNNFVTRTIVTFLATSLATTGCDKSGSTGGENTDVAPKELATTPAGKNALIARIGAAPGPILRDEGAAAVLVGAQGKIEIRALGEETFRTAVSEQLLYPGDQLRTAEGAQATLLFADESTAELAEDTTMEIGTRVVVPDPTSTAAVLSGVSRFNVKPRAPAEGPFIVFTPAGLVTTKGTTFGVGVAANGEARVGVEEGAIEVAGASSVTAPATIEADHVVSLDAGGSVGAAADWKEDDWGTWRDGAEARLTLDATLAAHAAALADLEAQLTANYAALEGLAVEVSEFEAQAAADAKLNASAAYEAKLRPAAVSIDASYLAALRLEWLTHAYAAHALLASELYVRHPELKAWVKVEPHVHAAVLWPKRLDVMAEAYLEPLRLQYYVHHARGRARAELVGVAVPEFYARINPPQIPIAEARAKLKFEVYAAPEIKAVATGHALWVLAPKAGWHSKLKVEAHAPRGKLGFWVRPVELHGKAILGVKTKAELKPVFGVVAPSARADLKLNGKAKLDLGQHVVIAAPNLRAAAKARAAFDGEYSLPTVAVNVAAPDVEAKLHAKADAKLSAASKAHASAKAKLANARAGASAGVKGSAKLEMKAPKVVVKAPKAKASAKASASFKFGR